MKNKLWNFFKIIRHYRFLNMERKFEVHWKDSLDKSSYIASSLRLFLFCKRESFWGQVEQKFFLCFYCSLFLPICRKQLYMVIIAPTFSNINFISCSAAIYIDSTSLKSGHALPRHFYLLEEYYFSNSPRLKESPFQHQFQVPWNL